MPSPNPEVVEFPITNGFQYVPPALLRMRCAQVYIEFLQVGSAGETVRAANDVKNHAVFKVVFDGTYGTSIVAVRINMRLDHDSASEPSDNGTRYTPGDLLLRTASYATASDMSARTIRLRYNREQNLTLGDLLITFMRPGVQLFGFITKGGRYFGCRDFVTQALYQMCSAGYVSPEIIDTTPVTTALHVRDAFSALGMRFSVDPLGQGSACPIDRGGFEQYTRIEREYMPYDRTQAAVNLAHQLNR